VGAGTLLVATLLVATLLVVGAAGAPAHAACSWARQDGLPGIVCEPGPARLAPPAPRPPALAAPQGAPVRLPPLPSQPAVAGTPAPPLGPLPGQTQPGEAGRNAPAPPAVSIRRPAPPTLRLGPVRGALAPPHAPAGHR
jgi:hypothetical protein